MIDRTNKPWNRQISDEEIYNKEFSIGYLIQSNQNLEFFQNLKDLVLSTYKIVAEFKYLGYNGNSLYCNNQKLVWRNNKFSDFSIGKDVRIVSHNLSHKGGGSNQYPSISYEGAKITLEFISYGLPFVDKTNGWSIEVMSLNKIN